MSDRLRGFLEDRIQAGDIPGAVWVAARGREVTAHGASGWAALKPRRRGTHENTVYDLASLTKPLATAALAVLLHRDGKVVLDEPVGERLPELAGSPYGTASLLDLLVHRSGLPAWEALYLHGSDIPSYLRRMAGLAPVGKGRPVVYSDLGYIAAAAILERATGLSLRTLFRRRLLAAMDGTDMELCFRPPRYWRPRIAATEQGNSYERQMVLTRYGERAVSAYSGWRDKVIRGQVHDHNAHVLGGATGHAGLFGTAAAVAGLATEFLPGSRLFRPEELSLLGVSQTPGQSEERCVGFQAAGSRGSAAGPALSPRAFGHVGFTGTSLFIDPQTTGVYVLLTNRIHPEHRGIPMLALRQQFHRLAAQLLDSPPAPR